MNKTFNYSTNHKSKKTQKYYSVHIEGLPYGSFVRKDENYSNALKIYKEMKENFYFYNCKVVLEKHEKINNKETSKIIMSKNIGEDFKIVKLLKDIENIIDKFDSLKQLYINTNRDSDKYFSAFKHSLEKVDVEALSPEQMREILKNIEEKGTYRRISKNQIEQINNIQGYLNSIKFYTNKAVKNLEFKQSKTNSQKAIINRAKKDNEYLSTIGLK